MVQKWSLAAVNKVWRRVKWVTAEGEKSRTWEQLEVDTWGSVRSNESKRETIIKGWRKWSSGKWAKIMSYSASAWRGGAEVRMSRGRGMRRGAILEKCWAVYLRVIEAEVRRWGNWPPSLRSATAAAAKWVTGRQTAFMSHNHTHAHAFSCHVFPTMEALSI